MSKINIDMLKKIKEWWDRNWIGIMLVFVVLTLAWLSVQNRENIKIDCTNKCEELNYSYFDSEPSHFFGLKAADCKCRYNSNKLIDIKGD